MRSGSKGKLLIAIISLLIVLSGCDQSKSTHEYIATAQSSLKQGKTREAIITLKNLLKANNKNAQARFLLGKAYVQQGLWLNAEKELSRANNNNFDPNQVLPLLATVYYHLNDNAGLDALLNSDKTLNKKSKYIIQYFSAATHSANKEQKLALNAFTQLVKNKTYSKYARLSEAWLKILNNHLKAALSIVNTIIAKNPNFTTAVEFKARILFDLNKMKQAAATFKHYLILRPQDHKNRLIYALALANANNFIEAEKQADFLLKISPHNALVNQIKAQARFAAKDFKAAEEYANIALQGKNDLLIAQIVAGVSAYQLKKPEAAYAHLIAIKDRLSFQHPARKLLMAIRFQLGYGEENYEELSTAPLNELNTKLLSASAEALFKVGKINEADNLLQKAQKIDPNNANLIYQQGVLSLLKKDDSAIGFFKAALKKDPKLDSASTLLVMKLVEDKKYNEALNIADALKERNPQLAYSLIGGVYNHQQKSKAAKNAFMRVLALNAKNIGALYNLARIAQHKKQFNDAVTYYEKILELNNQHIPSIQALLTLSTNKKLQKNIEQYFKSNTLNTQKNAIASLSLAEYYILHNNIEKAKKTIEFGLKNTPKNINLLMLIAKISAYSKAYNDALNYLNKIIDINPNIATVYASKASVFLAQGDLIKAINEQKMAIKKSPQSMLLKLNLAKLYIQNTNLNSAQNIASSFPKKDQKTLGVMALKGRIAFLKQDYQQAVDLLTAANKIQPSERLRLEIITILQDMKKTSQALSFIIKQEKLQKEPLSLKVKLKQAELYSITKPKKAIKLYKKLNEQTKNHFIMLNNLAWLYMEQGNNKKALINAQAALKAKPDNTAVQDTYGIILLTVGNNSKALTLLKKVFTSANNTPNYSVHYAQALLKNGYKNKARKIMGSIKKQDLNNEALKRFIKVQATLK